MSSGKCPDVGVLSNSAGRIAGVSAKKILRVNLNLELSNHRPAEGLMA